MAWWFGRNRKTEARDEPATKEDVVARVYAFLSDEDLQNQRLPQWLRDELARASPADEIPGATGEFGRDIANPIPVNGPFGEAQYLSSLVTASGQAIAFQRLGTNGRVDVYETISFDGREWDLLYLTKFFPRKSHLAPKGYRFATKEERPALIRGAVDQAEDFPFATHLRVTRYTKRILGMSIADPRLKAFDTLKYSIPDAHVRALAQLRFGAGAPAVNEQEAG